MCLDKANIFIQLLISFYVKLFLCINPVIFSFKSRCLIYPLRTIKICPQLCDIVALLIIPINILYFIYISI